MPGAQGGSCCAPMPCVCRARQVPGQAAMGTGGWWHSQWQAPHGLVCTVLAAQHGVAVDGEDDGGADTSDEGRRKPRNDNRHDACHVGERHAAVSPAHRVRATVNEGKAHDGACSQWGKGTALPKSVQASFCAAQQHTRQTGNHRHVCLQVRRGSVTTIHVAPHHCLQLVTSCHM